MGPTVCANALAGGVKCLHLAPVHVARSRSRPAYGEEEGCGKVAGGERGKGDLVVRDVTVVEGDLGPEGSVAECPGMEKEVGLLLEHIALDDIGVAAGFGTELVVEKEEPVGRCCHVRTPKDRPELRAPVATI